MNQAIPVWHVDCVAVSSEPTIAGSAIAETKGESAQKVGTRMGNLMFEILVVILTGSEEDFEY
jgi:hypothetical protein